MAILCYSQYMVIRNSLGVATNMVDLPRKRTAIFHSCARLPARKPADLQLLFNDSSRHSIFTFSGSKHDIDWSLGFPAHDSGEKRSPKDKHERFQKDLARDPRAHHSIYRATAILLPPKKLNLTRICPCFFVIMQKYNMGGVVMKRVCVPTPWTWLDRRSSTSSKARTSSFLKEELSQVAAIHMLLDPAGVRLETKTRTGHKSNEV